MKDLMIRVAEENDTEALIYFNISMAWETEGRKLPYEIVSPGVRTLLKHSELGFYLVAIIENEIAGALMITTEWSDWRNGLFWWLQSVYIRPEYRRQGIFTRLYKYAKSLSIEEPRVCGFRLYVERDNATAQRTYQSLGMQETSYKLYEEVFDL